MTTETATTNTVTIAGNGYALIITTPTSPVALNIDRDEAERLFDAGTNYQDTVEGEYLEALQAIL